MTHPDPSLEDLYRALLDDPNDEWVQDQIAALEQLRARRNRGC